MAVFCILGGLQKNYRRTERRDELLYVRNDQELHEKMRDCKLTPDCAGTCYYLFYLVVFLYVLSSFYVSKVDDELEIKAYYAGHVLGAAMFQVKVGANSVVYTVSFKIC